MSSLLKILLIVPFMIVAVFIFAPKTYAASGVFSYCSSNTTIQKTTVCKDVASGAGSTGDPVINIIKTAIEILSFVIGIAAVITIIIAGFRMIVSEGKAENISGARSAIIFAVIGLIVAAIAQLIVVFVLDNINK